MKHILILLLSLLTTSLFGQEQYFEKSGMYQKGDSVIWNKTLPIYITVNSELDTYTYQKPFYLDTEGINWIRTRWEYDSTGKYVEPQKEQLWKIYSDGRPPKTKVEFISSNKYIFKGKTYYGDDLKAKLTAKDAISGIKKTYYSINNSDFIEYIDIILFKSETDVIFKFYSVDNVGNIESIENFSYNYDKNNLKFGIDNIAPVSSIDKTNDILSPKDVISLTSKDDGVGVGVVYYRIDSGGYKPYDKPVILNKIIDGEHNFEYYGLDWINNQEESKHYKFYLDAISPEIVIDEEIIQNNNRLIKLSAIDNKSGVSKLLYQLKETDKFIEYTEPFIIDVSHQTIKIIAIDKMNNISVRIVSYSKK